MAKMTIDVDAIETLGDDLTSIQYEFENANANSDVIAEAVGHSDLKQTVHNFAHKWDDRRKKMAETISGLAQASTAVAQAWRDLDQQGSDALTKEE